MCSWQKEREEVIYLTRGLMTENSNVYKAKWKNANKKKNTKKNTYATFYSSTFFTQQRIIVLLSRTSVCLAISKLTLSLSNSFHVPLFQALLIPTFQVSFSF